MLPLQNTDDLFEDVSSYSLVVIGGGDGTISSMIGRIATLKNTVIPPLAFIPLGTGNDLCRELGLLKLWSKNVPTTYLDAILKGSLYSLSLCQWNQQANGGLFTNYLSIGFDSAVVQGFQEVRWRESRILSPLGRLGNRISYFIEAIRKAGTVLPPIEVYSPDDTSLNLEVKNAAGILITNIKSYLGLGTSSPTSNPSDNLIEIVVFPSCFSYASCMVPNFKLLKPRVLGSAQRWNIRGLGPYQNKAALPIQCDGDLMGHVVRGELSASVLTSVTLRLP
jgi:diacylglycerol kinase family enzyme